jgi:cobyrinic acid a,c-diamide synthase
MTGTYPRIMIAGAAGDTGKTVLSLGLLTAWREQGREVRAFKKGPDFIDAAWLGWATGSPGRNLDTYMMSPEAVVTSFREHGAPGGINLIEGNRGLLDGLDAGGSHSSAALARLLDCPVILVIRPAKMTATAAAVVLGCRQLAPEVNLAGVVLNQVAGTRHEQIVSRAIEEHAGVPVLGALPRLTGGSLTSRHLGLVPPAEHGPAATLRRSLLDGLREHVDLQRVESLLAAALPPAGSPATVTGARVARGGVRIGYFSDSAFTFYYPDNLEALTRLGASLVAISALADTRLPSLDALYIGGGFPETHMGELAANRPLLAEIRAAADRGLPVYAECGGLMYLAESLAWRDGTVKLASVLPVRVQMHERPQGHGYCAMTVDRANPFLPVGTRLRGHEFHYSGLVEPAAEIATAFAVERGTGSLPGRDGLLQGNVLASYLHLHALGCSEWAAGMVGAAAMHRERRQRDEQGED